MGSPNHKASTSGVTIAAVLPAKLTILKAGVMFIDGMVLLPWDSFPLDLEISIWRTKSETQAQSAFGMHLAALADDYNFDSLARESL